MAIDFEKKAQQFERFRAQESANTQEDAKWLRQFAAEVIETEIVIDIENWCSCPSDEPGERCRFCDYRDYISRRAREIEGGGE